MTTIRETDEDVWRPYEDAPLLTPAMARGPRHTPPQDMARLRRYLEAVTAVRRGPVHTTAAFNAAYFGFDTDGDGYGNGAFDLDAFPTLTLGHDVPALPVGALVRIGTGASEKLLYAEIIYKEGHPLGSTQEPEVPAWTSGAPADAVGPGASRPGGTAERQELLVPDYSAFGSALQPDKRQLKRLRDRRKWLDANGHVVVNAHYASVAEAGRPADAAYVEYLLDRQPDVLLHPAVPSPLAHLAGGRDQPHLRAALTGLLATVKHALATSDELRVWDSYALTRSRIGQGLAHNGPLGSSDLEDLANSLVRSAVPSGRRRHGLGETSRTVYTAVAPWLAAVHGAGELLAESEYAVSVCRANLALADSVKDTEGGQFTDPNVRVSLDDAFGYGGIWRSHFPGSEESSRDPLTATGQGWLSTLRGFDKPTQPPVSTAPAEHKAADEDRLDPAEPEDTAIRAEDRLGYAYDLRFSDSEVTWRVPLRLSHLTQGRFPLRPLVREALCHLAEGAVPVRVELDHPGVELEDSERVQDLWLDTSTDAGELTGVEWPIDFFPGLRITVQWPRGGTVFRLSTTELEEAVEVDGQLIAHAYDPRTLTRESAPGSERGFDSPTGLDARHLVLRAVRRCGLLTDDGHALLDRVKLPETVYRSAPAAAQLAALDQAVDELVAEKKLYVETGSRDESGHPYYPARVNEPEIPLIGYDPCPRPARQRRTGPGTASAALGTAYFVDGFLRRLPPGSVPSETQRVAYRQYCRQLGKADGSELPYGFTFVTAHERSR